MEDTSPRDMSVDMSVRARAPELTALPDLDDAWAQTVPSRRMVDVQKAALALRERIASGPAAVSVRTLPLATLVYASQWAYGGGARSPAPFVPLLHRALLVQFRQGDGTKTLLFNPTDIERARATPYFARLAERFGTTLTQLVARPQEPLLDQLRRLGIGPGDVDYLAFDHFHTQDLRGLLGTADGVIPPRFPNARLLAPAIDWNDWAELHPVQRAFYVAEGRQGVREDRVVLTAGDVALGDGVYLARTPGHTRGNQTLFFKTDRGVWGVSENGLSVDNWSPRASRVAGVAAHARSLDQDVLPNHNTPECVADQITSMLLEKSVVDRVPVARDFVQMYPSSQVIPGLIAPGLAPSYLHGAIVHGAVVPPHPSTSEGDRPVQLFGAPPVL